MWLLTVPGYPLPDISQWELGDLVPPQATFSSRDEGGWGRGGGKIFYKFQKSPNFETLRLQVETLRL